ncbi:hypothetical protein [Klebsiella pneumoniae]|uniref:hypothetical protein n=1 Tax=Klebsiella pneumoniae TaxID=573 RepID=UPI0040559971
MVGININGQPVPYSDTAKYLGVTLDAKLKWKEHVKKKKEELNIKLRKMYWLLGRGSQLTIENKLLIYKQVLRPVWTYGIQLWGCTKKTNLNIIQTFQNKVLRSIVDAPWYIRNDHLHRDLKVEFVSEMVTRYANSHAQRVQCHENSAILSMLEETPTMLRRLKRLKPHDLVSH